MDPTTASPAEKLEYILSLDFDALDGAHIPGLHIEGTISFPAKAGGYKSHKYAFA